MNIGSLLPRHATYRPDHIALVSENREYTYRELNNLVDQLANALLDRQLKKGDRFATVLPNRLEMMLAYWAAARAGLVIVPCSTLLTASGLSRC